MARHSEPTSKAEASHPGYMLSLLLELLATVALLAAVALLASTASHPMTPVHALGGSRGICAFDTAHHGGKASLPTLL